jgi:hypothetical protein
MEEPKKYAYQESDSTYHATVLSHFTYGRQNRMQLKSHADLVLENDRSVSCGFPKPSKFGSRLLLAIRRERVTLGIGFPPTCELFLSSLLHELLRQPEHLREDH